MTEVSSIVFRIRELEEIWEMTTKSLITEKSVIVSEPHFPKPETTIGTALAYYEEQAMQRQREIMPNINHSLKNSSSPSNICSFSPISKYGN